MKRSDGWNAMRRDDTEDLGNVTVANVTDVDDIDAIGCLEAV